jgi:hypothetical protein
MKVIQQNPEADLSLAIARHFNTSYPQGVQNGTLTLEGAVILGALDTTTTILTPNISFAIQMRQIPVIRLFNPSIAEVSQWHLVNNVSLTSPMSTIQISKMGFAINVTSIARNRTYIGHYTADARL